MDIRNIDMEEITEKTGGFFGSRAWNALLMAFGGGCLLLGSKIVPLRAVGGIAAALGTVVLANEAVGALRDGDFDPEPDCPCCRDCDGCVCDGCCPCVFDSEDEEPFGFEDEDDEERYDDPDAPDPESGYDMSVDGAYGDPGWSDSGKEEEEDEACSEI